MRILMYHEVVDGRPREVHAVSLARFARQMGWLAQAGYHVVSLRDWLAPRGGSEASTEESVAITFDDGYRDNYTNALPLLLEHGYAATIFLVAGCIGQTSRWRKGSLAAAPMLTWAQVREMADLGIHFGSHTVTHLHLSQLDIDAARRELSTSRQQIQERIGHPVRSMAYPYGALDSPIRGLVQQCGYRLACTYRPGYVGPAGPDPLVLQRIGILSTDDLDTFKQKVTGSLNFRLAWCRRLFRGKLKELLISRSGGA
jgi:peptidoglycan/xylan/chitin deacetylase (PgdA/CDA1 family)